MKASRIAALLAAACVALPAFEAHAAPCDAPEHRQFDFWLGNWDVYGAKGQLAGANRITSEYGGCVVHEHYTTPGAYAGESLNAWDAARKMWHQTWMDSGGNVLILDGAFADGRMVLEGSAPGKAGPVRHRITWTPNADGTVRQFWQSAGADGEWKTVFDGTYRRKP